MWLQIIGVLTIVIPMVSKVIDNIFSEREENSKAVSTVIITILTAVIAPIIILIAKEYFDRGRGGSAGEDVPKKG